MILTLSTSTHQEAPERRTRKPHAKVKTGCSTCKIRRKKCDETKPHCLRCTTTGRKCDGYVELSSSTTSHAAPTRPNEQLVFLPYEYAPNHITEHTKSAKSTSLIAFPKEPLPEIHPPMSPITFASEVDYYCFDFFRFNTGPAFESYFSSCMWHGDAIRVAFLHPVVLEIATALGAVHRRFNYGISRKAFEYCAIADRLHRKAISTFVQFCQEGKRASNYHEIIMLASMLFVLFETFQGNYDKAVQHTVFGLKMLLDRPLRAIRSESQHRMPEMKPALYYSLFEQLRFRVTQVLGSQPRLLYSHTSENSPLPLPSCFGSIEEASDAIFTEVHCVIKAPVRLWYDPVARHKAQNTHVSRILKWSAAFAETAQSRKALENLSPAEIEAILLLKNVRDALYTLMYLIFFLQDDPYDPLDPLPPLDTYLTDGNLEHHLNSPMVQSPHLWAHIASHASLHTKLARLALLTESSCAPAAPYGYSTIHSFSLDSGIGPPLCSFPCPEGSSKVRHRVRSLLSPGTESGFVKDINFHNHARAARGSGDGGGGGGGDGSDTTPAATAPWDSVSVYGVAEMMSSIEEHAVLDVVGRWCQTQSRRHRDDHQRRETPTAGADTALHQPTWVDITCFLEERRLLVRYCREEDEQRLDAAARNLLWVQEWLEF